MRLWATVGLTMALATTGCAHQGANNFARELAQVNYPGWILRGSGPAKVGEQRSFFGVGQVSGMRNVALARSTADNRARAELARSFELFAASTLGAWANDREADEGDDDVGGSRGAGEAVTGASSRRERPDGGEKAARGGRVDGGGRAGTPDRGGKDGAQGVGGGHVKEASRRAARSEVAAAAGADGKAGASQGSGITLLARPAELSSEQLVKTLTAAALLNVQMAEHWQHPDDGAIFSLARLDLAQVVDSLARVRELRPNLRGWLQGHLQLQHEAMCEEQLRQSAALTGALQAP